MTFCIYMLDFITAFLLFPQLTDSHTHTFTFREWLSESDFEAATLFGMVGSLLT